MTLVDAVRANAAPRQRRVFFSPVFDFLCLGGGSLLLLPMVIWLAPADFNPRVLGFGILLSSFITHPHFANSYQIFYGTLGAVLSSSGAGRGLRARYLWAGIAAPILLILFLIAAIIWGDARVLGLSGNAMAFLVGWHYVKQGYGVLIVDTALRRCFMTRTDKTILLINAHVCWIVSWLFVNETVAKRDLWGLSFAAIELPVGLLWAGIVVVVITTLITAWVLFRHVHAHRDAMPVAGIGAYIAALYPWVFLIREPAVAALIPAMHSLQYLVIVWRYQHNLESSRKDATAPVGAIRTQRFKLTKLKLRIAGFVLRGIILGLVGFWGLPTALDAIVPYDHARYGDYLFFFVLFVFINIHHYFIDHAMWRKENPHTLQHLFAHG